MNIYYLKTIISSETINKTKCYSMEESIEYFSKIKKLDKYLLLEIYYISN